MRVLLDAKYEKSDLHKFMETQCQYLTKTQRNGLLEILQTFKGLFDRTLGTWKNRSIRLLIKRGCEANMFATIPSTKVTRGNVHKGG